MNIAPDVNCPQCGMVIVCPHTPCVPYPPHCVNEPPPRIEWDGKTFLERVVQRKMYEAAQEYATNGWEVFPLHGKAPAIAKYRGGNGVHDATANVGQVSAWWSGPHKGCNIGIRVPESMFVLDVDGPHRHPRPGKGLQALAEVEEQHGPLPPTLTQITGSGGLHLFFRRPHGKLSTTGLPGGLEYKDRGGYVVGAPSVHPDSGERYVWCDHPVAAPPGWLADMIVEKSKTSRQPEQQGRNEFEAGFGASPADQFNASTSWAEILTPHGWSHVGNDSEGDGAVWLHPTHTSKCSATIRNGCLFVYSPNTPFEVTEAGNPEGYTKFRAHAALNHNGDMSAATRAILSQKAA